MASFDKMSCWPVGYFRCMAGWVLRNRRGMAARIAAIDAELARIGFVHVFYEAEEQGDGTVRMSETRAGISVTPGSSLERLLQAYIAQGGNPYDISGFMHPDRTQLLLDEEGEPVGTIEAYPHGGVLAPRGGDYDPVADEPGGTGAGPYQGGWIESDRYFDARLGSRQARPAGSEAGIVRLVHHVRAWANQEIKERLQDIEWRIVKLCDLREQLEQERNDVLVQAFAGTSDVLGPLDDDKLVRAYHVQNLVQDVYDMVYAVDGDGVPTAMPNDDVAYMDFTFPDAPSEDRDALGC